MKLLNKGISSILQPFIRKTFDVFLGDFIDSNEIDLSNLTINGVNNINLDVDKINAKHFRKSIFLLENANIGKMRVYLNFSKKIKIRIERLKCDFFVNEDIYVKTPTEILPKRDFSKKQREVEINDDNYNYLIETFKDYDIEIELIESSFTLRPTRPTKDSGCFEISVKKLVMLKSLTLLQEFLIACSLAVYPYLQLLILS